METAEYPDGQASSLNTLPFFSHVELVVTGSSVSSPEHLRPGGHVWHSSSSGLRM
jgi:hypothetical protein